jgi:hypothetical protein
VEGGFSDGWLGEQGQERLELEERARPAVGEDERDGVVASGRGVDEVQVEAVDRGPVVVEGVEPALGGPPVVGGAPVLAEVTQVAQRRTLVPALGGRRFGPAGAGQPVAQVVKIRVVDLDPEGAQRGQVRSCGTKLSRRRNSGKALKVPPESKFTDHWSSTQPFASTASTLSIQVVISPAGDPH